MSSNDQTEIESRISKEILKNRKRFDWIFCVPAWKTDRCFASAAACEIFVIKSFANRRPNAARLGVAGAGN